MRNSGYGQIIFKRDEQGKDLVVRNGQTVERGNIHLS